MTMVDYFFNKKFLRSAKAKVTQALSQIENM